MGIHTGIHQIVRFRNGELWHFCPVKGKGILVRRLSPAGAWEDPMDIISDMLEDFSVRIDEQDNLHLAGRSRNGELIYMFHNGRSWARQVLSKYEPARYAVKFPTIVYAGSKIHIILAIGAAFNTGFWSLYHYYWDGKSWHSYEITKLTAGYRLSPFYTDLTEKHIHLVYRGLASDRYQIFYARFNTEYNVWSTPENITQSTIDCNMPSLLVKDDRMHIVWTALSKNDMTVKYMNKSLQHGSKTSWIPETVLSNAGSNTSFPHLIWVEGKLWCVWCQTDTLFGCVSENSGETWSPAEALDYKPAKELYVINYTTNNDREKQLFKLQYILGDLEDTVNLPIVNDYMKLPQPVHNTSFFNWPAEKHIKASSKEGPESPVKSPSDQTGVPTANKQIPSSAGTRPSSSGQNLETIMLSEFEKQEENIAIIRTKTEKLAEDVENMLQQSGNLEAQLMESNENSMENKALLQQTLTLLHDNNEMLHKLKRDMELIREDIKQLHSKGFFGRLFNG